MKREESRCAASDSRSFAARSIAITSWRRAICALLPVNLKRTRKPNFCSQKSQGHVFGHGSGTIGPKSQQNRGSLSNPSFDAPLPD